MVRLVWLLPVVAALLAVPFVLDQNAWQEWANYLWLVMRQEAAIRTGGAPSLFLHESFGVFYPQYAFYGGTLWSLTGGLAVLLGSAWTAFLVMLFAAIAMAYGGTWWFGRMAGLGPIAAHAPAFFVTTTPYATGQLYGRGDWAELIATSALPLAYAGAFALLRDERVRVGPLIALLGATALVAGSHVLTLFWGGVFGVFLVGAYVLVTRTLPARRIGLVALAGLLGLAANAWFLAPQVAYAHLTDIYNQFKVIGLVEFNRPGVLFSPLPHLPGPVGPKSSVLYTQLPVHVLVWAAVAGLALAARSPSPAVRRAWWALVAVLAGVLTMIMVDGIWPHLPYFMRSIQFPLRLQTYAVIAIAGLLVIGLHVAQLSPRRRAWVAGLVVALAAQFAFSAWVATVPDQNEAFTKEYVRSGEVVSPFSGYQTQQFKRKEDSIARPRQVVEIAPDAARRGDVKLILPIDAVSSGRLATNIIDSPMVEVVGDARIVGRDSEGFSVLEVVRARGVATVRAARPAPVALGLALTLIGLGGALVLIAAAARRRLG